jgi:hypothetical protein
MLIKQKRHDTNSILKTIHAEVSRQVTCLLVHRTNHELEDKTKRTINVQKVG